MTGYGGTDAPKVPPHNISNYGFKKAADDFAELARILNAPKIILGGHDWGGAVVYRVAQWCPDLVSHVFSICTSYAPPSDVFYPTEVLVKGPLPQFGYQLHLAGPEVEAAIQTEADIEQFLNGMYGGKVPEGKYFLDPRKGVDLSLMGRVQKTPLLEDEVSQVV